MRNLNIKIVDGKLWKSSVTDDDGNEIIVDRMDIHLDADECRVKLGLVDVTLVAEIPINDVELVFPEFKNVPQEKVAEQADALIELLDKYKKERKA